jgi:3-hydroxyisobutyrate dehydrogenase and related beta-hydroxyacid dehydrogenases
VASSPAQAVRGAAVVITMLADGPATEQAATGPDGLLAAGPGTIWVQMATVGAEWTARLASIADAREIVFVDAPVSGSEGPAQAGELVILASGPPHVRDMLAPVFGALGRATAWLGPAGHGTRAKLVLNNWLADLTEATAETLSFARRLDLDPAEIVDLLQSTPLGAPYAVQKARSMLAGDFSPAFALKHALKDAELAAQAAQDQRRHPHPHQRAAPPLAGHRRQRARRRRPLRGLPHHLTSAAEWRTFAACRISRLARMTRSPSSRVAAWAAVRSAGLSRCVAEGDRAGEVGHRGLDERRP